MTDERKRRVLAAANDLFLRYGYRRTTMGDIAKAVGISRPALYLVYPCKGEIFKAGVALFVDKALAEIEAGLSAYETVREKLEFAFDIWTVRSYDMVSRMPDAGELIDAKNGAAGEVVSNRYARFEKILAGILEPLSDMLDNRGMTTAQLAHLTTTSARSIKENAKDLDELHSLITGLITMTMATLGVSDELPADRAINA